MFNRIVNVSSTTPGSVENSLFTPCMITDVTAEPSMPPNSILRNALPKVIPNPGSSG